MTEREWFNCSEPRRMLDFLGERPGGARLELFAAACLRHAWPVLSEQLRALAEPAEHRACGKPGVSRPAHYDRHGLVWAGHVLYSCSQAAYFHAAWRCDPALPGDPDRYRAWLQSCWDGPGRAEQAWQCRLARCVFGNPFRAVAFDPCWRPSAVLRLAQAGYDERRLPEGTLDATRLAVLADALEEAGCDNAEVLAHLRGPGPHVRGCWAVDRTLAKE